MGGEGKSKVGNGNAVGEVEGEGVVGYERRWKVGGVAVGERGKGSFCERNVYVWYV